MLSKLRSALTDPINLILLALTAGAGLCSAWWLAPVGALLWIVALALVMVDPNTELREGVKKRPAVAYRFQKTMTRMERTHARLYNTMQQTDRSHQRALRPVMAAANTMVDQAFNLAQRTTIAENNRVVGDTPADIRGEIDALNLKIKGADEERVRKEYENTLATLYKSLANTEALNQQIERAEAQLNSMNSELEQALTEVIRMRGMEGKALEEGVAGVVAELEREAQEAVAFS